MRQSGRTTRMLQEAIRLSKEGRAVYVIFSFPDEVRRARGFINSHAPKGHGIKCAVLSSIRQFDWDRLHANGAHPNCVFLVDHYVIERRFQAVLEMLHRFDPSTKALPIRTARTSEEDWD